MINFIKSLFGIDAVVNTAAKLIDKVAGTDFTAKERADWILKYQESTKHQSPARRFIAMIVTLIWASIVAIMILSYVVGNLLGSPEVLMIAKDMKSIASELVTEPFNYVIGFYFTMAILNGIKK